MAFSYTKIAILLLRIQGLIMILESIPSIAMAVIALASVDGIGGSSNYMLATFLQPVIGVVIYFLALPLATRAVSFLDNRD